MANVDLYTITKNAKAKVLRRYRLISLMSHTLKIFLRIIHSRIRIRCEENISKEQFGFRNGLGTQEALFCMNVLIQKMREFRRPMYLCFLDFEKAFDKVLQLFEILDRIGLDPADRRIISNLYLQQNATIMLGNNKYTEPMKIERGVRQGCILSPILFNIYAEQAFNETLENRGKGVKIDGEIINNIRYADDIVLLAENKENLIELIRAVEEACGEYGITINMKKTKVMVVSVE